MTPQQFIAKWGAPGGIAGPAYNLNEEQGAQSHFIDLCRLLDVPEPGSEAHYKFEEKSHIIGGRTGYADVFMRGVFAWENKAPGRNLDAALRQLLNYARALENPPLLVVSDRLTIRIHTQFTGHPSETYCIALEELDEPEKLFLLRRVWTAPESFRPKVTTRDITEKAARSFATLADGLRKRGNDADAVAHFLTQCLFCFFAEDVGLLPRRMFEGLVNNKALTSDKLTTGLTNLFTVMWKGGLYGNDDIPWFNGGLFSKVQVPALSVLEVAELRNAAGLNWSAIDVSIFGTLFERGLDPSKRSQLGAHYTDPATILRIIEPVLTRPMLQKWELLAQELRALTAKSTQKASAAIKLPGQRKRSASAGDKSYQQAQALFLGWLDQLRDYRILDPACGSGNFLFMGLKALKDIEHQSHLDAAEMGLDRQADLVTGPHNVLGIELNEYAAELARVTVWIGELQWRLEKGFPFKQNPVLEPLDHIECRDALLTFDEVGAGSAALRSESGARPGQRPGAHEPAVPKSPQTSALPTPRRDLGVRGEPETDEQSGLAAGIGVRSEFRTITSTATSNTERNSALTPILAAGSTPTTPPVSVVVGGKTATEANWPKANVVIGNPPFLGDKKMRSELGDDYTTTLRKVYAGRVPGGADLVCYWFEKARTAMESNGLEAAGLVATNSIRQAANRKVLDRVCESTKIFDAWSDEPWVNAGASVHVSLVCMGASDRLHLNGKEVDHINANLTDGSEGLDSTAALPLTENESASFFGFCLAGPFLISGDQARNWLFLPNPNMRSNAEVLKPIWNGKDITERVADRWAVDFGGEIDEQQASLYEKPFEYVRKTVLPVRAENNRSSRVNWWFRHGETRPGLRQATRKLRRYIGTVERAKHRYFVWMNAGISAEHRLIVIPREDDATFGILSSRIHVTWAIRAGSTLVDRPGYNTRVCFLPFPFPQGLTPTDTAHQRTETLEDGAVIPVFGELNLGSLSLTTPELGVRAEFRSTPLDSVKTSVLNSDLTPLSSPSPIAPLEHMQAAHAATKNVAIKIAIAAKHLNDLREAWLNPPEWTDRVPEVTPLGMDRSPYPDRILPKAGFEKQLAERTLTKLYNQRPAWLDAAHKTLDMAVAHAYCWNDYTANWPDEEILKRLLALNLERASNSG
jgi:hypothetical protein